MRDSGDGPQRAGTPCRLLAIRLATPIFRRDLVSFALSDKADSVNSGIGTKGEAAADVHLKLIPLDIVGHLTCQVPWTENRSFTATLRDPNVSVSSGVKVIQDERGSRLTFDIPEHELKLKLQPGPTELLLTSPNMTTCLPGIESRQAFCRCGDRVYPRVAR